MRNSCKSRSIFHEACRFYAHCEPTGSFKLVAEEHVLSAGHCIVYCLYE